MMSSVADVVGVEESDPAISLRGPKAQPVAHYSTARVDGSHLNTKTPLGFLQPLVLGSAKRPCAKGHPQLFPVGVRGDILLDPRSRLVLKDRREIALAYRLIEPSDTDLTTGKSVCARVAQKIARQLPHRAARGAPTYIREAKQGLFVSDEHRGQPGMHLLKVEIEPHILLLGDVPGVQVHGEMPFGKTIAHAHGKAEPVAPEEEVSGGIPTPIVPVQMVIHHGMELIESRKRPAPVSRRYRPSAPGTITKGRHRRRRRHR